jgi:hypothetical protein
MTEDEAKKKWCPFTRVHISYGGENSMVMTSANRSLPANETSNKCIGSACMAWRKKAVPLLKNKKTGICSPIPASEEWDGSEFEFVEGRHPLEGYCGLAGKL